MKGNRIMEGKAHIAYNIKSNKKRSLYPFYLLEMKIPN